MRLSWSYVLGPPPGSRPSVWRCRRCRPPSPRRKELCRPCDAARASPAQFGDGQSEIAHLGGEQPLAVAVAVGGALIRAALMARGTNGSGDLSLQQILETPAHDLRDQGASGGALHELTQLGGATMGAGHGLCSVWW